MFSISKDTPVKGKAETLINCSSDNIFNFVGANFIKNYPRWSPEVVDLELLTDGSVEVGTKCRQVRIDQGKRSESTFEVTVFNPGERICFEGISNPYRCDYVLKSEKKKSESSITFTFELLKLELFMKPFEKLIRVAIQEGTEKTVLNIKKLIESEID